MRDILKLNLHTRKVCFLIETGKCCGVIIDDHTRFTVLVKKDSIVSTPVLIEYPFFDADDEGRMCLLLDDDMTELCSGRYVFNIMLDECILVKSIKFLWGAKPVVTNIKVENNPHGDCYDETGGGEFKQSPLVKVCCDSCGEGKKCYTDPCDKCNGDPCSQDYGNFHDPQELLKRDC